MREPEWVLRLLGEVLRHEDEHAKGAPCFGKTIALIPSEVKIAAQTYDEFVTRPYAAESLDGEHS